MPREKLTPVEEIQNIIDNLFGENHTFDPQQPRKYYVSNICVRALSHLYGKSLSGVKELACTTNGELKVAVSGSGYEHNITKTGNAPDAYTTPENFGRTVSRVEIFAFDFACVIRRGMDGVVWDDEIEVPANSVYGFDGQTQYIDIKNKTPGSTCRFQFVGWY